MNDSDVADATDLELVKAAAAGNVMAFDKLYERYERRVFNYVKSFVRQPALAEDVVIETMTVVWQSAPGYAQRSRVSTWILGIARHKALDALRKLYRQPEPVDIDEIDQAPAADSDPVADVEVDWNAALLERAMAGLSDEHREALRLAFYEELPYEEIAMLLGVPNNTVKTRVYYAKQQLRRLLAHTDRLGAAPR
jgi:RNA polymerase sigma-70 factor, ECF subfamily